MTSGRRRGFGIAAAVSLVSLVLLAIGGCGAGQGEAGEDGRIPVVASTDAWASVVTAVGGDEVSVKAIIGSSSADPHSYESTATDGLDVAESALMIYNGGGYDDFAGRLAEQDSELPTINAFEVSGHGADEHADEHAEDTENTEDAHQHGHGENEHVWYDLDTVAKVADAIATRLGEIRPESAGTFTDNAKAFKADLDKLAKTLSAVGAGKDHVDVLATEPVAHYLIDGAGIDDVTPKAFSEATEGETDVPVAMQDEIMRMIKGKQVSVVINNPQTETPVTGQVVAAAKDAGVPVVDITETLPDGVSDYVTWIGGQVDALSAAVG
ncbi:MAG: metal ABC transporter substrate-binding protein [Actinophytocola sp.]|nr:metal ABC transporter substrate-binding protein [Actinophytocola sp.]